MCIRDSINPVNTEEELQRERANNQSALEQAGNAVVQAVGNDWTAEEQQMFLPLVLKADYLGSMEQSGTWLLTAGAGVALFASVWMLAGALTGRYQKCIRAYCKASESPEAMLEQLETFYQSTEPVNGAVSYTHLPQNPRLKSFLSKVL